MSIERLCSGDTVTVQAYAGESATGAVYEAPVEVDCRVQADRKLVRNTAGDEVVSETTLFLLPTVGARRTVDLFAPESVVTHDGRRSQVISCAPHRGLGSVVYVEVVTT